MPIIGGKYQNPGWANDTTPAIDSTELNAISDTLELVPVENGGTGVDTLAELRDELGLGNTTDALPIANGGTGATTAAGARNALGLGNTSGALPLANGGTGQTAVTRTDISVSPHTIAYMKWGEIYFLNATITKSDSSVLEVTVNALSSIGPQFPVLSPTETAQSGVYGTAVVLGNKIIVSGDAGDHYFTAMWIRYNFT